MRRYISTQMGRTSRGRSNNHAAGGDASHRKSASHPSARSLPINQLSYAVARAFLGDPHVKKVVERRHLALGWQHASNISAVLRAEMAKSVGRYVESIHAIPIAIGKIAVQRSIYIIEDQNCMHLDVHIHMIVFDCNEKNDRPLKCKVMLISDKTVVGQLYGIITVINNRPIPQLQIGDEFQAYFVDIHFDDDLCQLLTRTDGKPARRVKKNSQRSDSNE